MSTPADHLVLQTGLRCKCGDRAICWARCRKCRVIVARCGGHHQRITIETAEHCP